VATQSAPDFAGKNIASVGGGNTAMDACRTAVRLGAREVYNIYRRTKNEMPAEAAEIAEAEEEGVVFKNLTNPIEVVGENGRVKAVRLQVMELGEPDASGRRSPVPVPGKEEVIGIDAMLVAIGQKTDMAGIEVLDKTRWGTIVADEHTFLTNLPGVFAVGDATDDGAGIAITAIGEAKRAAETIGKYLNGEALHFAPEFLVKSENAKEDFADREPSARVKMPCRRAGTRRNDFLEGNLGLNEDEAMREAMRCLECGCSDFFECKLIGYARQYCVHPEKYGVNARHRIAEDDHPFIRRDPDKCILCGLCVRVCDEAVGAAAIGLVDRGFAAAVKPALDKPLSEAGCISCGQCVAVCPTGALAETQMTPKQVPLREDFIETVCPHCEIGCKVRLATKGGLTLRALPAGEDGLLCRRGRFGFDGNTPLPDVPAAVEMRFLERLAKANGYTGEMPPPGWGELTPT
jgi:formate dehydrogenase major subunit